MNWLKEFVDNNDELKICVVVCTCIVMVVLIISVAIIINNIIT